MERNVRAGQNALHCRYTGIYTGVLEKCEAEIESLTAKIKAIRDYDTIIRKRKGKMKKSA